MLCVVCCSLGRIESPSFTRGWSPFKVQHDLLPGYDDLRNHGVVIFECTIKIWIRYHIELRGTLVHFAHPVAPVMMFCDMLGFSC